MYLYTSRFSNFKPHTTSYLMGIEPSLINKNAGFFFLKKIDTSWFSFLRYLVSKFSRSVYISFQCVHGSLLQRQWAFPVMAFHSNGSETVMPLNCLANSSLVNPSLHKGLLSKSLIRVAICSGKSFCSVSYPVLSCPFFPTPGNIESSPVL